MTQWLNRIVRYGEEAPEQLLANPRNFRTHPNAQRNAMRGVLDEIGFVAPVIVNENTGHVLDGHLRIEEALSRGQTTLPVAYVRLSEVEEAEALATFDRLGALAGQDAALLDDLLRDVSSADSGVQEMLAGLAASAGLDYDATQRTNAVADVQFKEYDESIAGTVEYCTCPACGHKWPK